MSLSFTTPLAALVGLVALVPIGVVLAERKRLHRLCARLGLEPPQERITIRVVATLAIFAALLALAAAQPVAATHSTEKGRADAEAFFVFDTSRSMAARTPRTPTRLDRARADAKELRGLLADVPVGVASITDRTLPHLFPSMSQNDFNATLDESLAIDRPTTSLAYGDALGTKLGALGDLVVGRYFDESAKRRVAIVFTDGETLPQDLSQLPTLMRQGNIKLYFFRYWRRDERIYDTSGRLKPAYTPDAAFTEPLTAFVRVISSRIFEPGQTHEAAAAVRAAIGTGPTATRGRELSSRLLTPYVVLLALLPLAFLLGRDEWSSRRRRRRQTARAMNAQSVSR
jgi:hypothetical protein